MNAVHQLSCIGSFAWSRSSQAAASYLCAGKESIFSLPRTINGRTVCQALQFVVAVTVLAFGISIHPARALETDIVGRVKDIVPGMDTSDPGNFTNINGTLYFRADASGFGFDRELWKSDGTAAGTVLVKDIDPDSGSFPGGFTNVNGTLYFSADDGANGHELWKSDGTAAGTVLVKDIAPGGSSFPSWLTNVNGTLFFRANDGRNGHELWKSDGTAAGTLLVKDINPNGNGISPFPRGGFTNVNGTLYFNADDGTSGRELWKSDGTTAGTVMIKDIAPGAGSSFFLPEVTNVNGTLYFSADDGMNGEELWKSDGTAAGTVLVKDIDPAGDSSPGSLTNVNGSLYFTAIDGTNGRELWKSDGTTAGTVMIKDIAPGTGSSFFLSERTNVNGTLYFSATNGTNGNELWKSDGTAAGTVMVKDIAPIGGSFPFSLANVNGTLFFQASDGTNGEELWKSDGTAGGTVMVKDIHPLGRSYPDDLTNLNGVLYFRADDGVTGSELWRAYVRTDTPPVFDDVPLSHPFYNVITNFAISGYTSGCSVTPSLYCPSAPVTRAQMAIFLNRGVNGQDFVPEPATGTVFDDVPIGSFAAAWIETFRELQITGGCSANPPLYCPGDSVTRAQMAIFLLKVIHGSSYTPPTATGGIFADVPFNAFAANWIEQLAKENITRGCGNGNFCPNDAVTRGQMAAFLTRVFHTPQLFE